MSNADYTWYMAFDDAPSHQIVSRFLAERGEFESSSVDALLCPDDLRRPALIVHHEVITQAMGAKMGKSTVRFKVLRQAGKNGKLEFWLPAAPKKKRGLPEGVFTGAALLDRKRQRRRQPEAPLVLPGAE